MKVLPASSFAYKPVFLGYTVEDNARYGYPETHLRAAMRTNKRYDKTLGSYHKEPTNKIYYADPLEKITDELREKVDYIFYDDEPAFPDIEKEVSTAYFMEPKSYIYTYLDNYRQAIDAYKQYFYRMEMADSKFVGHYSNKLWNQIDIDDSKEKIDYYKARISDAKYNQETAGNCISIMNEATGKINYKKDIARDIASLEDRIIQQSKDIPKTEKELEQKTKLGEILSTRLDNLKKLYRSYNNQQKQIKNIQKQTQSGIQFVNEAISYNEENMPDYSFYTDFLKKDKANEGYINAERSLQKDKTNEETELKFINSQLEEIKKTIDKCNAQIKDNKAYIMKLTDYKQQLPKIISDLKEGLKQKTDEYYKVQAELIPYFDKLKNYFYSRGLRQVKY